MCRWKSVAAAALLSSSVMVAQEYDPLPAVAGFTGSMSPEEMDAEETERLEYYLSRPLRINIANPSRLRSCGLLVQKTCASTSVLTESMTKSLSPFLRVTRFC